ncbi:glycoside hydrolase family 1 protein [Sporolactobacillus sp. KGMB 08714]|uniref:glycoside hydrolase family 1 protein n=1 Tax=Sporolactobacillus sp. KGMB 08714 TaxID=3064704 RepID=UPI002FBF0091
MTLLTPDFFWGNSTSSIQTEGAAHEGGKGPSLYDLKHETANSADWNTAIDEYHRYAEDISLMKDLGMNFYRFQVSWSRVQPRGEGDFNEEGIAFYHRLVDELLAAGIQPMICLYHFDLPLLLAEKYNGFVNRKVVDAFYIFARRMIDEFAGQVAYWITFNEQNLYSLPAAFKQSGYLTGDQTPYELYQIQHHIALAHAKVANYIHTQYPELQIGGMLAYQEFYPATPNPQDIEAVRRFQEFVDFNLLRLFTEGRYSDEVIAYMKHHQLYDILKEAELAEISLTRSDFISFSYYATATMDSCLIPIDAMPNNYSALGQKKNPYLRANEWGWQIDPQGFYKVLMDLSNRTHLPVFPIENGIGVREKWDGVNLIEDNYRIDYHREHIRALKQAVSDGANVIGYLGWGLIDIPSSQGDVEKRYGVVFVNRNNHELLDLKRVPKRSYRWLKQVIASNAELI